MSEPRRESPLVQCEPDAGNFKSVTLREQAYLGHINLRGDVVDAVREIFSIDLPVQPNRVIASGAAIAMWTGPDEWLVIHGSDADSDVVNRLESRLGGRHASVVDLSSAQTVIALKGAGARDVLARGCPLDLHPREFNGQCCAQSHFSAIPVTLWLDQSGNDDAENDWINVVVRRSFADYLWRRLVDAARAVEAAAQLPD